MNWVHWGRTTDFKALEIYHKNRNANRELLERARKLEAADLAAAAELSIQAIEAIPTYAHIKYEGGLIGRLMDDETAEFGSSGEFGALDRLSMCLCKLGRAEEAAQRAEDYFSTFRRDRLEPNECPVTKRISKALARAKKSPLTSFDLNKR